MTMMTIAPRRRRRVEALPLSMAVMVAFTLFLGAVSWVAERSAGSGSEGAASRHLLQDSDGPECTNPGLVILQFIGMVMMFAGLAIVCDDFFVVALEKISEALGLTPDIAGATFMAAGSSAPEMFTSLSSVLNPSDTGVGTIVGSAIFNVTVIIAVTLYFAGKPLKLDWRPLVRDTAFYFVAASLLVIYFTMGNMVVDWWEAVLLMVLYVCYIMYMKFNERIMAKCPNDVDNDPELAEAAKMEEAKYSKEPRHWATVRLFTSATTFGQKIDDTPASDGKADAAGSGDGDDDGPVGADETESPKAPSLAMGKWKAAGRKVAMANAVTSKWKFHAAEDMKTSNDWEVPASISGKIMFFATFPLVFMMRYTIPDCNKPRFGGKWYIATFIMSIAWIGLMSNFMVTWANNVGCALGIPPVVMGLTVLAAGTSVPDALSSVIVARNGLGGMAVANSLGSNVFDIVMGLGLPWLLGNIAFGRPIAVDATGIGVYIGIDFGILALFIALTAGAKWTPGRKQAYALVLTYLAFVAFGCMTQMPSGNPILPLS